MDDYTEVEDYDCTECNWSLHVEKAIWNKFDDHQVILDYIQDQVMDHARQNHGVDKSKALFPVDKDITIYRNSPYVYYSDKSDSSLKEIK